MTVQRLQCSCDFRIIVSIVCVRDVFVYSNFHGDVSEVHDMYVRTLCRHGGVYLFRRRTGTMFPLIVHNSHVEKAVTMMTYGASSEPFYHQM